jgi:hypothetical protein
MRIHVLMLLAAATLFVLATIPKIQRPWMIPIGLALMAFSFTPYLNGNL